MMVPTNTYSIANRVEPKEKDYILGYTDKNGTDYIGIHPDFEKEQWFNRLIQEEGLEELCRKYPYQQLKVNKDTGMLESIHPCEYLAKLTNCFHAIYHMRMDDQNKEYTPSFADPSIELQSSNFIANLTQADDQVPAYELKLEQAYHREKEEPVYVEKDFKEDIVEKVGEEEARYTFRNMEGSMLPEGGFENVQANSFKPQQVFGTSYGSYSDSYPSPYNQGNVPYPAAGTAYGSVNPYVYTPQSTYLSQYRTMPTTNLDYPEIFADAYKRKLERDEANMKAVNQINAEARANNPTMLEQSNYDFSNPESVERLRQQYTNPFVNNMQNPNIAIQQNPYGINNPWTPAWQNPGYGYAYGFNYQNPYYSWNTGYIDLSFMDPTTEDIQSGKYGSVSVVTVNKQKEIQNTTVTVTAKESSEPKLSICTMVRYKDRFGIERVVSEEEYDRIKDTLVQEEPKAPIHEEEQDSGQFKIYNRDKNWYSKDFEKKVTELAEQLAVYDEARALCLVGSLSDLKKIDFNYYYTACEEKLRWYRINENAHPNLDYRVPHRYRRTPKKILDPITMQEGYEPYDVPRKKTFTFPDGTEKAFYDYDRGSDPSEEEWKEFYAQACAIRDREIIREQAKAIEEYNKEKEELEKYNPWNPLDVRLHELKVQNALARAQHDIFREAYGGMVTDEQFDSWWYGRPKSEAPDTDYQYQKDAWRRQMMAQHISRLDQMIPIDPKVIQANMMQQVHNSVHQFDQGYMDDCKDLKDFFDRLGYLNVRVSEENVEKQRRGDISSTINKEAYQSSLQRMATESTPGWNTNTMPGVDFSKVDPAYNSGPNYVDFTTSALLDEKRQRFMNYCQTSNGTISLRPIYR